MRRGADKALEHLGLHGLHVQQVELLHEQELGQLVLRRLDLVGALAEQCAALALQRLVRSREVVVIGCHDLHLTASLRELGLQLDHRCFHGCLL